MIFLTSTFSNKITLLKEEKKFSSIGHQTEKLQEFKVERFWELFVTVTVGKSRFDGTGRLAFRPWQWFICILSDRPVPEISEGRFASFLCSCALCTGLVCFVRIQDEGAVCSKITIGVMFTRNFGMGELRWVWGTCSCFGQLQGRGAWFGESLKADPQTPWPNDGKANACFFPLHSLLLGFEIAMRSFHAHSFSAEVLRWTKKKCVRPA